MGNSAGVAASWRIQTVTPIDENLVDTDQDRPFERFGQTANRAPRGREAVETAGRRAETLKAHRRANRCRTRLASDLRDALAFAQMFHRLGARQPAQ